MNMQTNGQTAPAPQSQKPCSRAQLLEYLQERHPSVKFLRSFETPQGKWDNEHMHTDMHQLILYTDGAGTSKIFNRHRPIALGAYYYALPKELHSASSEGSVPLTGITCRFKMPGYEGRLLPAETKLDEAAAKEAEGIFKKAFAEFETGTQKGMLKASFLLAELLLLLSGEESQEERAPHEPLSELVSEGIGFMNESFKEEIGIDDVAAHCGVTASHFSRAFKKEMGGVAPLAYLRKLRLGFAIERIFTSKEKIADIAERSGFKSPKNLNMAFQQAYGMSPQEYRRIRYEEPLEPPPEGKAEKQAARG